MSTDGVGSANPARELIDVFEDALRRAMACAVGAPPAMPPLCNSSTCNSTGDVAYDGLAAVCEYSVTSYRETHRPGETLMVFTLTYR